MSLQIGELKMKSALLRKIKSRKARIVVMGLGRVGLPVATLFADAGFMVVGVDVKQAIVERVLSGKSYGKEPMLDKLVKKVVKAGRLKATVNAAEALRDADIVIICVQTPITERRRPNLSYLKETCNAIGSELSKGMLVVVESTVPFGTTRGLIAKKLEEKSGLMCGRDFWLAYCPERTAPGRIIEEFVQNPRLAGGFNEESAELAAELFGAVVKGDMVVMDCTVAEVAKLAENTFRDVNIAFANELALICEALNVDVMEVIKSANTHPRVKIHLPGSGVGGPGLPKDPFLLQHEAEARGFRPRFIELSREINDSMPKHTVNLVIKALKETGKDIEDSKVAVLGVAYTRQVGDVTNSPAEKMVKELISLGADVVVYDPYTAESFGAKRASDVSEAAKRADCIVIATDHNMFKKMNLRNLKAITNEKSVIVDGRRVVDPTEADRQGFKYLGIGRGVQTD